MEQGGRAGCSHSACVGSLQTHPYFRSDGSPFRSDVLAGVDHPFGAVSGSESICLLGSWFP